MLHEPALKQAKNFNMDAKHLPQAEVCLKDAIVCLKLASFASL
jgi:hypothetical protein